MDAIRETVLVRTIQMWMEAMAINTSISQSGNRAKQMCTSSNSREY
jgi:hypothetical protein